jgi:hypothetical protein
MEPFQAKLIAAAVGSTLTAVTSLSFPLVSTSNHLGPYFRYTSDSV